MTAESRTRVVVGVTGSIAAFKAAALVSKLVQRDLDVFVVLTRAACRLVTPDTFQALSGHRPLLDLFEAVDDAHMGHLSVVEGASLLVVAPATANFIGKCAAGIADDALTTAVLAAPCPVLVAPAMNPRMWENPAVQENVRRLRDRGYRFAGPEEGRMAEGVTGWGRMVEPHTLLGEIEGLLPR